MAQHIDKIKAWLNSFSADVSAIQALVGEAKLPRDARLAGAAALNYLVTRLDLIPDWEEVSGIVDDAMVMRLAMAQAAEHALDGLSAEAEKTVHRLANEADGVRELLGDELHNKLRRYVSDLANVVVRGRHPRTIVDDAEERARLYDEVKEEIKRVPLAVVNDPDRIERTVKNYVAYKLK